MLISAALALLSGILYVLSFAPWDQAYLQWICFLPLFYAVERLSGSERSFKNIFKLAFILAFLIGAGGFYWTIYATQHYGGLPYALAFLLYFSFCIVGQLQVPAYFLLREKLKSLPVFRRSPFLIIACLGILYAGIEAAYPKIFKDTAGNAFYDSPWIRQAADLGGPFFLTTLLIWVNELFFASVSRKKKRFLFSGLGIIGLVLAYGFYRTEEFKHLSKANANAPVYRSALVQANIGDYLKIAAEQSELAASAQVMHRYLDLSRLAAKSKPPVDSIIWPETAYPAIFERPFSGVEMQMETLLKGFLKEWDGDLIFGGYDLDFQHREYNSLYFYHPLTAKREVYHKSVLLMFGETLPFVELFPSMKSWFPSMGFFGRGPGPEVFEVKNRNGDRFKLAPSICYEGLFTDHSVKGALLGADALLNVTNDSWFGPDGEPYLHLALTRLRSVETRLPMIRATNTGFTVFIDELGNQTQATKLGEEAILTTEIKPHFFPESPYVWISRYLGGDWYVRFCEMAVLLSLALLLAQRRQLSKS